MKAVEFSDGEAMAPTIAALKLKPVISEVLDFEKARDALAKLQDKENSGKVVIRIDQNDAESPIKLQDTNDEAE